MDIRHLTYFLAVVDCGSFTKAAQRLHVAQTALSYHMRNLEAELRTPLLYRSFRGVEPTEAGEQLVENARHILDMVQKAKQQAVDFSGPPSGQVMVGMPSSVVVLLAPPLLRRCQSEYPGITISVVEDRSNILVDWVHNGQLNLALAFDAPVSRQSTGVPILIEDLHFVQSGDGNLNSGEISVSEVLDHKLIMCGYTPSLRRTIDDCARRAGKELDILFDLRSVHAARELTEQGVSATILPYAAVIRQVEAGRLVARRIIEPQLSRTLWLVLPQLHPMSRAEIAVRAVLMAILTEMAASLPNAWRLLADGGN